MRREQCYQFRKFKTLRASVQFFPEIMSRFSDETNRTILDDWASRRKSPSRKRHLVLPFEQEKLVNMARYRNILRYQLGFRSLREPIIVESPANATITPATVAHKHRQKRPLKGKGKVTGKARRPQKRMLLWSAGGEGGESFSNEAAGAAPA